MAIDLKKYKIAATPTAAPGAIDLAKYKTAIPAPAVASPNLGELAAQEYAGAGQKIVDTITKGAAHLQAASQDKNPLTGIPKSILATGELGLGTVAGFARGLVAPVTAVAKKLFGNSGGTPSVTAPKAPSPIAEAIKSWAEKHPEAATNLQDALTVGLTALGGESALLPGAKTTIGEAASTLTSAAGDVKAGLGAAKKLLPATKTSADQAASAFSDALEISRPKMTPTLEKEAFNQGRVGKQGIFKPAPVAPSASETRIAEAVQPLVEEGRVSPKFEPTENKAAIDQEVHRINQGVREMLNDPRYNQPFNGAQLSKALDRAAEKNRLLFAGDETAQKAYDAVIAEFKTHVAKKTVAGLFEGRQSFDRYIRENFPNAFKDDVLTGSTNPRAQALRDTRTVANEFISDLLPVNNPYRAALRRESDLIRAADNIGTKIRGITQEGKLGTFLKSPKGQVLKKAAIGAGVAGGVVSGGETLLR